MNREGPDVVGEGVEHDRVGGAIRVEHLVLGVAAASAGREGGLRGADVGAVQQDGGVVVRDGRVHGCDSCVLDQQLPCSLRSVSRDLRHLQLNRHCYQKP